MSEKKPKFYRPPLFFEKILCMMLTIYEREGLCGDFAEIYNDHIAEKGKARAMLWYWRQILAYFPKFIFNAILWRIIMFWNYLKITLRNIRRHKGYSFINISGLAVGMACTIIILLWVQYELSYDRFHENSGELYRVISNWDDGGRGTSCPGAAAKYLKDEYPEIINSTRYFKNESWKLTFHEKSFLCSGCYVDSSFFEMFSFPFAQGNPKAVFSDPNSIILTEDTAHKFFGTIDPIGKTINIDDGRYTLTITGVIRNIPHNSHIRTDFFIPAKIGRHNSMEVWNNNVPHIYIQLQKNSSAEDIGIKIAGVVKKHDPEAPNILELQPLIRIHLYALDGGGRITYIYIFSAIAFIILFIACINFMNLSTARSTLRLKEIGVRKVVGATRLQLIKQFLSESILISIVALGFALVLVELFRTSVSGLLGQNIHFGYSGILILGLIGVAIFTGIISGSYPAFSLSSFGPIHMLKKSLPLVPLIKQKKDVIAKTRSGAAGFRKILVVFQFSLSIGFIICVMTIYNQLNYMKNKDLGYNRDHVIVLKTQRGLRQKFDTVKKELLRDPDILEVSGTDPHPVIQYGETAAVNWEGKQENERVVSRLKWVDYDYLKTMDIKITEGRFFSREFPSDASRTFNAWVINEKAVEKMGLKNPIGKEYSLLFSNREAPGRIIGVFKDFHNEPLHDEIRPLTLILGRSAGFSFMSIRIRSDNIAGTIRSIERKIKTIVPDYLVEYHFLSDELNSLYKTEQVTNRIMVWATFLAIFISCLGLFGLASFSSERRTKEIGIRKVLGASVSGIVLLLSRDFSKWVLFANIFAWPVSWYAMNKWLQSFPYRTTLGWWTFLLAGILALIIALLTVSYQAAKAAFSNPVEVLRYE